MDESTVSELMGLLEKMYYFRFKEGDDKWKWGGDKSGLFSIASVKKLLYQALPLPPKRILEWNSWVPLKVNVFAWKALQDRLATTDNLIKRKVIVGPGICSCCMASTESVDHVFTSCYVASVVWQSISSWCNIPPIFTVSIHDIFDVHKHISEKKHKRKIVQSIIMVACWCI